MEELRRLFSGLALKDVETFIASGNLIFSSRSTDIVALEQRIESRLEEALGYEVKTFIRTEAEVAAIARYQPFSDSQLRAAGAQCVGFLARPLGAAAKRTLMMLRTEIDEFHVHGREVYWLCKKRQSESTFSNMVFEKSVQVRATFRGVNTISRLVAKYGFLPTALALLLLAACAGADFAPLPAPPAGYEFAYAAATCAPWDGRATTLYFTSAALDSSASLPPSNGYLSVALWRPAEALPGATFVLPATEQLGAAANCPAAGSCELASAANIHFRATVPDGALEGTLDVTFPDRRHVSGGFHAVWRPQREMCG
jgi:uncharacterized protein (DUF1697 family)